MEVLPKRRLVAGKAHSGNGILRMYNRHLSGNVKGLIRVGVEIVPDPGGLFKVKMV